MDSALKFYEKVEQFPKSSVYPYAVYKKGWCYVNLGDYKTALETFVGVVRMTQEGKVNVNSAQKEALEKEAKKDIVKAYAHVGGPDKAWEFFQRTGGDFAPKMMEALAELYWEQGKFADSTRVYKKVISQNMDSPRICEWQNKIVRNTLSAGQQARPGPGDRAPGRRLRQGRRDEGRQEGPARGVPQHLPRHVEGAGAHLAQGSAEDQEPRHLRARQVRLQGVPRPLPEATRTPTRWRFYYGELLWTLAELEGRRRAVHQGRRDEPEGKYVKEAAYAAVLAWKNALNVDDHEQKELVEKDREAFKKQEGAEQARAA